MTTTKPREFWIDIRDVNRSHLGESVSWILKHSPKTRQINYDNEFMNDIEAQAYYGALDRITQLEAENANLKKIIAKELSENDDCGSEFVIARISREENAKLKDALKWYADRNNWKRSLESKWADTLVNQDCALLNCGGGRARIALKECEGENESR